MAHAHAKAVTVLVPVLMLTGMSMFKCFMVLLAPRERKKSLDKLAPILVLPTRIVSIVPEILSSLNSASTVLVQLVPYSLFVRSINFMMGEKAKL